ncbi:MAG: PhzF family phenazine biosynthesis protein [Pseudomonadota bacterium]
MPRRRPFAQVDVFGRASCTGNGLAVVLDGEDLTVEQMQDFSAWSQLAEVAYINAPEADEADYAVRIFAGRSELPFAGHPTLGTCAAWLTQGGRPAREGVVVQECAIGLVEIDVTGDVPAFVAPPTDIQPMDDDCRDAIAAHFGLDLCAVAGCVRLDNGPKWSALELHDEAILRELCLSKPQTGPGLPNDLPRAIGFIANNGDGTAVVRMVTTDNGYTEDPVTGSLNSALAHWLEAKGELPDTLSVSQGREVGRDGLVQIRKLGDHVLIGGAAEVLIDGAVRL